MNIPLDRLYQYIQNLAKESYRDTVLIYRFWPHGSKNLNDLRNLYEIDWSELVLEPQIYCYDQEPLNYKFYYNKFIIKKYVLFL